MTPSDPKTVLYLTPSSKLLGARRSLLALADSLDPDRWQPIVCGQDHGDLEEALAERDIPYEALRLGAWRKGKFFLWRPFAIASLRALVRRVGATIVHCNEIYSNPYAVRACEPSHNDPEPRVPVVTHMRLSVTPRMSQNYDLRRADLMVIPSGGVTADFESWPDRARRVRVVYNGVDLEEFRRSRSRGEARRTIGVPNGGPLLAVLGQLGPRKGGDVILKAFAAVAPDFPGAKLMFVGNSHRGQEAFGEQLKATAAARPELMDRVFFFPYTRHILPYYEAADLNLLISRDEGFGRTIIEAGAMGTPSIGTRVGGIPEVIDPGKTGLIVEPDDPDALAAALRTMLSDPEKMKSLGEAAFRHVAHDFSIKRHAEEMMDLYDGVVENSRSPH